MEIRDSSRLKAIGERLAELSTPGRSLSGFVGQCTEATPFGQAFWVIMDGKSFLTCTHAPPHLLETD